MEAFVMFVILLFISSERQKFMGLLSGIKISDIFFYVCEQ